MNLLASAYDSGSVHLIDLTSKRVQRTFDDAHRTSDPHTQGASTLAFTGSGLHLITGGNDGSVKLWDIRGTSSKPLTEFLSSSNTVAHGRKFDEGVMCVAVHPESNAYPFFATGGADSLVNVYELNNI